MQLNTRTISSVLMLTGLMFIGTQAFAEARIIGGTQVSEATQDESYPWITALLINGQASCGASLIGTQWVLTAAHCVTNEETGVALSASNYSVVVNDYDLGTSSDGESRTVTEVYVADGYDTVTLDNDIAILKLSSTVTSAPIALMSSSDFNALSDGASLKVMGWGNTSINRDIYPNILREVNVDYANFTTCKNQYAAIGAAVTDNMFCAGGNGQTDSCQGDSGGPIMQLVDGTYQQVGIVSTGGTQDQSCAALNYPGIYTRLSNYQSWISSVMAGNETPGTRSDDESNVKDNEATGSTSSGSSSGSLGGVFFMLMLSGLWGARKRRVSV